MTTTETTVSADPVTARETIEAQALRGFAGDTAQHQMIVLHDDGLYRHVRFAAPDHGFYWFDLVAWPGNLVINGDMEQTFAFSRTEDMFEFFRGSRINPGYWAEKLRAPRPDAVKEYSEDRFRERVLAEITDMAEAGEVPDGLTEAIRREVLENEGIGSEDLACAVLRDFEFEGFEFADVWEWDLTDWSYQFLWCCHAIRWGVSQYDAAKAGEAAGS